MLIPSKGGDVREQKRSRPRCLRGFRGRVHCCAQAPLPVPRVRDERCLKCSGFCGRLSRTEAWPEKGVRAGGAGNTPRFSENTCRLSQSPLLSRGAVPRPDGPLEEMSHLPQLLLGEGAGKWRAPRRCGCPPPLQGLCFVPTLQPHAARVHLECGAVTPALGITAPPARSAGNRAHRQWMINSVCLCCGHR